MLVNLCLPLKHLETHDHGLEPGGWREKGYANLVLALAKQPLLIVCFGYVEKKWGVGTDFVLSHNCKQD